MAFFCPNKDQEVGSTQAIGGATEQPAHTH